MAGGKILVNRIASAFVSGMGWFFRLVDKHPVEEVSVRGTQELLRGESAVIVDVRSDAENAVSRIPGAITRNEFESSLERYRGRQVITYCTIGGRSLMYARRLVGRGWDAASLKVGIIGWCESDLPLVTPGGEATNRIHTHTRLFQVPSRYEQVNN